MFRNLYINAGKSESARDSIIIEQSVQEFGGRVWRSVNDFVPNLKDIQRSQLTQNNDNRGGYVMMFCVFSSI